ncbi:MAG: ATP phosphoribosyltransferase regulatory subunit [Caldilineaceae bacterium]|nr:ATP phosphoribosyltransferase regulatory subunit [Caldilineaceae bacterium]
MAASASQTGAQAQIPRGVADYFWAEAYARRVLESALLDLFRAWGYQDVIPPMFEYADTFLHRSSAKLQTELYRFLDRDGSTLTLRADMTIPVARLVGVRLHDRPMPQRFCYAGSVFRHTETQAGRQREFTQAGFELVGAASPAADAEVIALTIHAMRAAGLRDFKLVLGQLQYFYGLLQDLQLPPEQSAHLQRAIDRNSDAELADFLRDTPLRTQQRHTIEQLPLLSGPNAEAIIAHADRLCLNYAMHKALANLRDIYQVLKAYGVTDQVYLDLTEINNLGYYTGISFEILVPGVGFPLGGGGRYDNLVGTFGTPQPAVGVALGIDRILNAQRTTGSGDIAVSAAPHLLIACENSADALALVSEWRSEGLRVVVSLDEPPVNEPSLTDHRGEVLWQTAQQAAVPLAAIWTGQGFDVYGLNADQPTTPRFVPYAEAATIAAAARSAAPQPRTLNSFKGSAGDRLSSDTSLPANAKNDAKSNAKSEEQYGLRA